MCDTIMIDFVMLKIHFLSPAIKCSMFTIGCVISMVICDIPTIVCDAHSPEPDKCSGQVVQLVFLPHNSVS